MPTTKARRVGRSWHLTYPERWREELRALRGEGLAYRISHPDGGVRLNVRYPVGEDQTALLRIDFDLFPWFPPTVCDPKNGLALSRHRHPSTGTLCLIHQELGWDSNTTVAELLVTQVPKLLAAEHSSSSGELLTGVPEVPIPDGANAWRAMSTHAVIVPTSEVPRGAHGNLTARASAGRRLSAIVLDEIHHEQGVIRTSRRSQST